MAAPAIVGVTRARPRIDLGVGDSRDAQGLGQWQPAAGNAAEHPLAVGGGDDRDVDVERRGTVLGGRHLLRHRDRNVYRSGPGRRTVGGRHRHHRVGQRVGVGRLPADVGSEPVRLDGASGPPGACRRRRRRRRAGRVVAWLGRRRPTPGFDAEYGDIVTLECIDAKGEVGRVDIAAVDPPVGAGEAIHARLDRICRRRRLGSTHWRNFDTSGIDRRRHRRWAARPPTC